MVTGSITSPVTVNNVGKLTGIGSVGSVILSNLGSLAPGKVIGFDELTINGNYTQTCWRNPRDRCATILQMSLLRISVAISGSASVDGTLKVSLWGPGLRPLIGTTYPIITSNGLTGNFSYH